MYVCVCVCVCVCAFMRLWTQYENVKSRMLKVVPKSFREKQIRLLNKLNRLQQIQPETQEP